MKRSILMFCLALTSLASCSSTDDSDKNTSDGFDRTALLTYTADQRIIPIFKDLQAELTLLESTRAAFENNPNSAQLEQLSAAWLSAYKVWQHLQMYNLGQAATTSLDAERGFRTYFNRYPVDQQRIEELVAAGDYDFEAIPTYNAQGFPGLDFLLHGTSTGDAQAIDKFTSNTLAANYQQYLKNLVAHMQQVNTRLLNDWQNEYRATFINNTQNGQDGSFNQMANDFVFFYEKGFRAEKFGIPAGVFSNQPLPDRVEGLYKKDVSKDLALAALDAIENAFNGKAYQQETEGPAFKQYLEFLDRNDLVQSINQQFEDSREAINQLDDNFYLQVQNNNSQMTQTYDVIQAAVPKLKVDMKQALDFSIDYQDSDGD